MEIKTILNGIHADEVLRYRNNNIPAVLIALKQENIGREQLVRLINRRYQLANMFEGFLEHIMAVVKESNLSQGQRDALYNAVHQNYLEEIGSVKEYGGPHSEGREMLLNAMGYSYTHWQKSLGSYQNPGSVNGSVLCVLQKLKEIVNRGPIEAITALWYYENRISLEDQLGEYYILLSAFEKTFPRYKKPMNEYKEGDVFWHLASHASHDTYHAKLAVEGLNAVPYTNSIHQNILSVYQEMRTGFDTFWDTIESEIK